MNVQAMRKALEAISVRANAVRAKSEGVAPVFGDARYSAHSFSMENFRPISKAENKARIAFVDGGNAEILGSPSFSLSLVRTCFCVFRGGERVKPASGIPGRLEFYCAARSVPGSGKGNDDVRFEADIIPLMNDPQNKDISRLLPDNADLSLGSWDETIKSGVFRASISQVGAVARRLAEWKLAEAVLGKELFAGDVLVRDGTLQSSVTGEAKHVASARRAAEKSGAVLSALAKTSSLFMSNGESIAGFLNRESKNLGTELKEWYYHPIADISQPDHQAEMFWVRLNKNSKHSFRFEVDKEQAKKLGIGGVEEILAALKENSRDLSFPGYPYGLISADRFARVTFREAESHRAAILSLAGKGFAESISESVSASDAHEKL